MAAARDVSGHPDRCTQLPPECPMDTTGPTDRLNMASQRRISASTLSVAPCIALRLAYGDIAHHSWPARYLRLGVHARAAGTQQLALRPAAGSGSD